MKLPTEWVIHGVPWEVSTADARPVADDVECDGLTEFDRKRITIFDGGRSRQDLWRDFFHELTEALVDEYRIKSLQGYRHHDDLDKLACAMFDTLAANGILKFPRKREKGATCATAKAGCTDTTEGK